MTLPVFILESAKADFKNIGNYVVKNFGNDVKKALNEEVKAAIQNIGEYPFSGSAVEELEEVGSGNYRQLYVGSKAKTRIVYEVRKDAVYVHIFMDTRRDLNTLLQQRMLSST